MTSADQPDQQPFSVRRSIEVEAPIDDVWDVVIDDDERAGWFGGPTELTPVEGTEATFTEPDGTRRSARIESVVPGRHLGWTWWDDGDDGAAASRVTIDLTPSPAGTRIDILEAPARAQASVLGGVLAGQPGRFDPVLELEHRLLILAAGVLRRALGA